MENTKKLYVRDLNGHVDMLTRCMVVKNWGCHDMRMHTYDQMDFTDFMLYFGDEEIEYMYGTLNTLVFELACFENSDNRLTAKVTKFADLFNDELEIDLDVYDCDTDDEYAAFVSGGELTDYGRQKYKALLDLPTHVEEDRIIVDADTDELRELLHNCLMDYAGYCAFSEWDRCFEL